MIELKSAKDKYNFINNLVKESFYGKTKIKDGISFNSILNGNRISFAVYDIQQMFVYETFTIDSLKEMLNESNKTEREQFIYNLVTFLLDVKDESKLYEDLQNPLTGEEYDSNSSVLDIIRKGKTNTIFPKHFILPNGPCIYAFKTDKVNNAIKIGYTDQHPLKRIDQWKEIYGKNEGEVEVLGYWSSEEINKVGERVFFWDHAVHKKVQNRGYANIQKDDFYNNFISEIGKQSVNNIYDLHYSKEFFYKYRRLLNGQLSTEEKDNLSADLIYDIIKEMKNDIHLGNSLDFKTYKISSSGKITSQKGTKIWKSPDTYDNTDLQKECIENGVKAINNKKKNILMAAVMRFGKTHAAYEIVKQSNCKKVLVTSAKADVREAWRDDINHIDFYKDFVFVEPTENYNWDITALGKNGILETIDKQINDSIDIFKEYSGKTIIIFATLQDLAGSLNEVKKKHQKLFNTTFDLLIVDETHYGSHSSKHGEVTKLKDDIEDNEDLQDEEEAKELRKQLDIKATCTLQVSGTPYYILASNEMLDKDAEIISKVSYTDMIKARDNWRKDHPGQSESASPYYGIPTLHKIGLRLNQECRDILSLDNVDENISNLFQIEGDSFKYEDAIKSLMTDIFGNGTEDTLAFLKNIQVEGSKVCKHTLMVLPRITACILLKKLLQELIDTTKREIICVVGYTKDDRDVKDVKELNNKLIDLDKEDRGSIILTVNRFLTGVSMPFVDSMIYLKSTSSPQEYDQNIFRLCTRNVADVENADEDSPKKVNRKQNVYLIDFNISNMMNMLANSARMKAHAEGNVSIERVRELMNEDLETIPIVCESAVKGALFQKFRELTTTDLLKYYTSYNSSKSISETVNDDINRFDKLFIDSSFQSKLSMFSIQGMSNKNTLVDPDNEGEPDTSSRPQQSPKAGKDKEPSNSNERHLAKEKFTAIVKNLLYCNLCLDSPYSDMESVIKDTKQKKEFSDLLKEFKLDLKEIIDLYNMMSIPFKSAFNDMLCRISLLATDISEDNIDLFLTAIKDFKKIDKNEVVTPPELVERMIDKLSPNDYNNAKHILLVHEKQGEFFCGLMKKYPNIGKKCKIVCSSNIAKYLTKKVLKAFGLSNDINNIILKINSDKFKDMAVSKKFDICLMNPPFNYGKTFFAKVLSIANCCVTVQPTSWLFTESQTKKITDIIDKSYAEIEVLNGNKYFDAGLAANISINYIDKRRSHQILLDGKSYEKCSDIKKYSHLNYLEEFRNLLGQVNDSIWDHIKGTTDYYKGYENSPDNNWYCVKIPEIRGHVGKTDNKESYDFYTIISNDDNFIKENTGKYKKIKLVPNRQGKYEFGYFAFKTNKELNNFINYIKTDFVRTCLFLKKTHTNQFRGCMSLIPWFDFSESIFSKSPKEIDDYLFKEYNISDDIRKYIEEILPDYYGIRN